MPLEAAGPLKGDVAAFARVSGKAASVTIAPRLLTSVASEGELPEGNTSMYCVSRLFFNSLPLNGAA